MNRIISLLAGVFIVATTSFSQDYTKEVIELWEGETIPFNKQKIKLKEMTDKDNKRLSQISKPVLFVYRKNEAKKDGAALLYIPGGGYSVISIGTSRGESEAKTFFKMGFQAVAVLKYRLPDNRIVNEQEKVPLCDAQKALAIVHRKASDWGVDRNKIGVKGASAGGHLTASLNNLSDQIIAPGVKADELKQAFSILRAPVITFEQPLAHAGSYKRLLGDKAGDKELLAYYSMEKQVTKNTPPTFVVNATDDASVPYENSVEYVKQLASNGIPHKYVKLGKGGHGFGVSIRKTDKDWISDLDKWLHETIEF